MKITFYNYFAQQILVTIQFPLDEVHPVRHLVLDGIYVIQQVDLPLLVMSAVICSLCRFSPRFFPYLRLAQQATQWSLEKFQVKSPLHTNRGGRYIKYTQRISTCSTCDVVSYYIVTISDWIFCIFKIKENLSCICKTAWWYRLFYQLNTPASTPTSPIYIVYRNIAKNITIFFLGYIAQPFIQIQVCESHSSQTRACYSESQLQLACY